MFSKNILAFLCAVGFVGICAPDLEEGTVWDLHFLHTQFRKLDWDRDGVITDNDLIKIVTEMPSMFTVQQGKLMIQRIHENYDNVLNFPAFVRMNIKPRDYRQTFKEMFGDVPHVTRTQIKDFFLKVFILELTENDFEKLDPGNKNEITFNDMEKVWKK